MTLILLLRNKNNPVSYLFTCGWSQNFFPTFLAGKRDDQAVWAFLNFQLNFTIVKWLRVATTELHE